MQVTNMMRECPYPGLRPFERGESHLFFGRDEQIEQLLDKLAETRFIAVTGLSGCGKSSLVRAGLLANLEYGYLTEAGADWRVFAMRPGLHPLRHLAESLLEIGVNHEDAESVARSERIARISQQLASGGHLELARMLQPLTSAERPRNVLLLVDQFEELFRYESQGSLEERRFFVEMLLTSAAQQEVPIYIVITIRSDWLGQCAQFRGLPEIINAGQYLVPRLTPEQLRLAIVAPAQVAEGAIEDRLVLRLLQEIENNQDQLPVLQHCLMRMWTRKSAAILNAHEVLETSQVCLTEEDYDAVGGLLNALSNHADDAYNQLTDSQKQIAEILFRRLSERGANQLDMRRPTPLGEVAAVAGVSANDVKEVVEAFRHPDCCFLTPAPPVPLESETALDISHESFIRLWERLQEWVEQEAKDAEEYQWIEKEAWKKQEKKGDLLSGLNLGNAIEWRNRAKPTATWAARYGQYFDLVAAFIDASVRQAEEIQAQAERQRQEALRRTRRQLALASIAVVVLFGLTAWAWRERSNAQQALQEKIESEQKAETAKTQAESSARGFQDMNRVMFSFLLHAEHQQEFLKWVNNPVFMTGLDRILSQMIEQSEIIAIEQKRIWNNERLPLMNSAEKIKFFGILGNEYAEDLIESRTSQTIESDIFKNILSLYQKFLPIEDVSKSNVIKQFYYDKQNYDDAKGVFLNYQRLAVYLQSNLNFQEDITKESDDMRQKLQKLKHALLQKQVDNFGKTLVLVDPQEILKKFEQYFLLKKEGGKSEELIRIIQEIFHDLQNLEAKYYISNDNILNDLFGVTKVRTMREFFEKELLKVKKEDL